MIRIRLSDDLVLRLPLNPLTYDELHALTLGSIGYWFGRQRAPLAAATVCLLAIGGPRATSPGLRTLREEPWYFITAMVTSYLIGRAT